MKFSLFGQRLGGRSAIRELMEDLGTALTGGREVCMLGGGNPAHIPAVLERLRERWLEMAQDSAVFARMIGDYDAPQGERGFIEALADLLRRTYGWTLNPRNILLTHGSQSAFFLLFNLFAGPHADGRLRRIFLPLTPEYVGYGDIGVHEDFLIARRPRITLLDAPYFKYHLDLHDLPAAEEVGAICLSRPANPTGNVVTDAELAQLHALARRWDVPLIVDGAYGLPFPDIVFTAAEPHWDEQVVLCLSLSKLGLPAARTGIIIAAEPIIDMLTGMNAVLHLATGSVGAALACDWVRSGEILTLSREHIRPYYRQRLDHALQTVQRALRGCEYRVHQPEGAIFLWLWFPQLSITSCELYRRLKARGVLVLPGHYFFPGLPDDPRDPWPHRHECIRLTYAQEEAMVEHGIGILAEEIKRACSD
ncbi:MAG TPA: valine--pyruvate transaminase [Gammaproteobacteria bacterium]|nr:valine--pyruvate transaminase [Gammaproteobacteria bacterium]